MHLCIRPQSMKINAHFVSHGIDAHLILLDSLMQYNLIMDVQLIIVQY